MLLKHFRLFYLCQDTMLTYITEETFFNSLTWLCHALCGIFTSAFVGYDFIFDEYEWSIINSYCTKMPKIILLVVESDVFFYNLGIIFHISVICLGVGIQIAIFMKQKQLEKQQSVAQWAVSYSMSGVKMINRSNQISNRQLWKHKRNVVSPMGSFLSFLSCEFYMLLIVFNTVSKGPPIITQIILFSVHVMYFFCFNLIKTICSPTLHGSLINVIPWRRHAVSVV